MIDGNRITESDTKKEFKCLIKYELEKSRENERNFLFCTVYATRKKKNLIWLLGINTLYIDNMPNQKQTLLRAMFPCHQ